MKTAGLFISSIAATLIIGFYMPDHYPAVFYNENGFFRVGLFRIMTMSMVLNVALLVWVVVLLVTRHSKSSIDLNQNILDNH